MNYEDWLDYCFDRSTNMPEWWWKVELDEMETERESAYYAIDAPTSIGYHLQMFSEAALLPKRFTPEQIGFGLNYIFFISDEPHSMRNPLLVQKTRLQWAAGLSILFREAVAPTCPQIIQHTRRNGDKDTSPAPHLSFVTYMFWDVLPIWPRDDAPFAHALIKTMTECLALNNIACQESAIHGLGHYAGDWPKLTGEALQAYIRSGRAKRAGLLDYAKAAQTGYIQ